MEQRTEYPNESDLINWFNYHAPNAEQQEDYKLLRAAGYDLSLIILRLCPPGPDRTVAIRKVREAVMTANASIACGGR